MLNRIPAGLLTFDRRLEILFTNQLLAAILDIRPGLAERATSLLDLLRASAWLNTDAVQSLHAICLNAVDEASEQPDEYRSTLRVANARSLSLQIMRLPDGYWMAAFEEVTTQHGAEAAATRLALCDPLTGLANRQQFLNQVAAALAPTLAPTLADGPSPPDDSGPAVLLVDLDRFKTINDTLGHAIGDDLLRLVCKRLLTVLRHQDVLARLGGDEFALLVFRTHGDGLAQEFLARLAVRIVDMLGRPYLIDGQLVNITASVGVAHAPRDGAKPDQLLRNADLALYDAKNAGRGTHRFFKPEMDARDLGRRTLEIDLRRALPLRQFVLHYQPQIDLESDTVVGFEALVRWQHPDRGLVSPAEFIPIAEEIGLIVAIGEWVLREACHEAARWPDTVSIAVNVSSHQFQDTARLIGTVSKSLVRSGLPGRRLEIEITESVLLRNEQAVLTTLQQLRAMGVRVAMDDFGTGYSSLSQLHSFPFDKIKIDRSFVKDRSDVTSQGAIIRAITALGASLGMATIAEGVETQDQLARVRAEGCTSVQGYLFSRPVPVEQVGDLLARFAGPAPLPPMATSQEDPSQP